MADIIPLVRAFERSLQGGARERDNGGSPPTDPPDMEPRVAKLEALAEKTGERLAGIERDLAIMKTELHACATKEDMAKLEVRVMAANNKTIMWVVSAIFLAQLLPSIVKRMGM